MPSLVRSAGPAAASLVIFIFCVLSSACALLLLKSMTLIEGNACFSERYEYSAILRYFLTASPPPSASPAALSSPQQQERETGGEGAPRKGPLEALDEALYKATGLDKARPFGGDPDSQGEKETGSSLVWRIRRWFRYLREEAHLPAPIVWVLTFNQSSLPQAIAFVLYANSFLSASSAALLVAYCIDALLLRVLGWTIFIPILPCGGETLFENVGHFCRNIGDWFALSMWPLRRIIVSLWRLQGTLTATATGGDAALYSDEAVKDWDVGPEFTPFVFITSPQQLEEIFSGVCTAACDERATAATAAAVSAAVNGAAAAATAACVPCLKYIGISLGYFLTAAAGLRLAASDLEDTMRLQFISFFAVVAAVLNVCAAAFFRLSNSGREWSQDPITEPAAALPVTAAAATTAAAAAADTTTAAMISREGTLLAAATTAGDGEWGFVVPALHWVFGGFFARTAIPSMVDAFGFSSSLPSWANEVRDEVPVSDKAADRKAIVDLVVQRSFPLVFLSYYPCGFL